MSCDYNLWLLLAIVDWACHGCVWHCGPLEETGFLLVNLFFLCVLFIGQKFAQYCCLLACVFHFATNYLHFQLKQNDGFSSFPNMKSNSYWFQMKQNSSTELSCGSQKNHNANGTQPHSPKIDMVPWISRNSNGTSAFCLSILSRFMKSLNTTFLSMHCATLSNNLKMLELQNVEICRIAVSKIICFLHFYKYF